MNKQKTILISGLLILIIVIYYYSQNKMDYREAVISDGIETTDTPKLLRYKTFISHNKKLVFSHREDWKCNEVVYDIRIDCYPLERVEEEYDAGLDEATVYFPDISFHDDNKLCNTEFSSAEITEADNNPLIHNEFGENYYGLFYKKFNNCLTKIVTLPYINTVEKLTEIIK